MVVSYDRWFRTRNHEQRRTNAIRSNDCISESRLARFEDFLFDLLQAKGLTNVRRDVHEQVDLIAEEISPLISQPVGLAFEAKRISGQVASGGK